MAGGTIASAQWMKSLHNDLGLTQSELAERLGVTYVTISRRENGQARPNGPSLKATWALAQVTGRAAGGLCALPDALPEADGVAGARQDAGPGAAAGGGPIHVAADHARLHGGRFRAFFEKRAPKLRGI